MGTINPCLLSYFLLNIFFHYVYHWNIMCDNCVLLVRCIFFRCPTTVICLVIYKYRTICVGVFIKTKLGFLFTVIFLARKRTKKDFKRKVNKIKRKKKKYCWTIFTYCIKIRFVSFFCLNKRNCATFVGTS